MIKEGRKASTDPVQEKLRQNKAQWNKGVSAFIGDLINLKKTMNGWPSKFHMERSYIREPIPADPHTILGVLAADFQELAQKGNDIIQQQIDYSKSRKKSQPKTNLPAQPAEVNLSQQLAASYSNYNFISEGSSSLTRFFSRLKGPWFGSSPEARNRKYRLAMLQAASVLNKELEKFEVQILGSSPESIFIAGKMIFQIENHLFFITDSLSAFKSLNESPTKNELSESTEAPIEEISNNNLNVESAQNAISDFRRNYANFSDLDVNLVKKFSDLILKFLSSNDVSKVELSSSITQLYQEILSDANAKHGTNANSLADILISKKSSLQMQIVAQNIINKWLGKAKHHIDPFDKTSAIRLDINKISEEARDILDKLMNSLEKQINIDEISLYLSELEKKIISIKTLMRPLESSIRGKLFDKTFINLLQDNKLPDYKSNLDPKQKERLEKMLQNKQFRDLTNFYAKR